MKIDEPGSEWFTPTSPGRILSREDVHLTLYGRPREVESPADVVRDMRRRKRSWLDKARRMVERWLSSWHGKGPKA